MEVVELIKELVGNLGLPIALVVYFAWRDVKYMDKLDETLNTILTTLNFMVEKKGD